MKKNKSPTLRGSDAAAVIVAGGSGKRFGGPVPKQYLPLLGRPVLAWSVAAFEAVPSMDVIVLVVPEHDVQRVNALARKFRFRKVTAVVAGGKERRDSVRNGLAVLPAGPGWVAVHDAVRPLVTPHIIEQTLQEAKKCGAALAACPSRDTVKLSDANGFVRDSPVRERVWLAQTPQIFERKLLERAHGLLPSPRRKPGSTNVTDDAQMLERQGVKVRLVDSPAENFKITQSVDLKIAGMILKARHRRGSPQAARRRSR